MEKKKGKGRGGVKNSYKCSIKSPEKREDEVMAAIGLAMLKHPRGVTAIDIIDTLTDMGEPLSRETARQVLVRLELANKIEQCGVRNKSTCYRLAPLDPSPSTDGNVASMSHKDDALSTFPVKAKPQSLFSEPQAPAVSEARAKIMEAITLLESLARILPGVLAILLDVEKNFGRYDQIRDIVEGIKKSVMAINANHA